MDSKIETYKDSLDILNSTNEKLMDLISNAEGIQYSTNKFLVPNINIGKILICVEEIKKVIST